MKFLFAPFIMLFLLAACKQTDNNERNLQTQIDSLQIKLDTENTPHTAAILTVIKKISKSLHAITTILK